jgi:hypothetical protein
MLVIVSSGRSRRFDRRHCVPSAHKSKALPAVNIPRPMLHCHIPQGKAVDPLEMPIEQSRLLR